MDSVKDTDNNGFDLSPVKLPEIAKSSVFNILILILPCEGINTSLPVKPEERPEKRPNALPLEATRR